MARKFALLSFAVLIFKLNQSKKILKDAYRIIIYKMTKLQNRPSRYGNGWQYVTKNIEVYTITKTAGRWWSITTQ